MTGVWGDALEIVWKSTLFVVLLIMLLRLMGKREMGSLTPIDLVVLIMLSEAAIISIADKQIPLIVGVTPVLVLAGLELLVSWLSLKSPKVRDLLEGKPSFLIRRGRIDEAELARQRLDVENLLAKLRQVQMPNVADVEYAVMETGGNVSVVPKSASAPATAGDLAQAGARSGHQFEPRPTGIPLSLVIDGVVSRDALRHAGRSERWLRRELRARGLRDPAQVLLAEVDAQGRLNVQPKAGAARPGRAGAGRGGRRRSGGAARAKGPAQQQPGGTRQTDGGADGPDKGGGTRG